MRKYIYLLVPLSLVLALCLTACSSDKANQAAEQELLAAINSYLAQNPPAAISPTGAWSAEAPHILPFDLITHKQPLAKSRAEHPALFALADAGVLTAKQDSVISDNVFGKSEKLPVLHVDLTE